MWRASATPLLSRNGARGSLSSAQAAPGRTRLALNSVSEAEVERIRDPLPCPFDEMQPLGH
jgi:hypothetical protein